MKSSEAVKIFYERFNNGFSYRYFNFERVNPKKGYQNHDEISRGLSYEGCKAHLFSGFILATDLASWRYKVVCREVTVVVVCVLP